MAAEPVLENGRGCEMKSFSFVTIERFPCEIATVEIATFLPTTIVPVRSSFSVTDIPQERLGKRLDRWRRIAREAAQQSGASRPPTIEAPLPVEQVVPYWSGRCISKQNIGLVLHHEKQVVKVLKL